MVRELEKELRENSALRHRLGIEGGIDTASTEEGGAAEAVVFSDKDGVVWALPFLEQEA